MHTRIVPIGNSQGIRIPKPLLEQSGLGGEVDVSVVGDTLVIRPSRRPRADWDVAFQKMSEQGDDRLLDEPPPALSSWDEEEWQW